MAERVRRPRAPRSREAPSTPAPRGDLALPARRGDLLTRPRLHEALDESLEAGAALLVAPAGYGKTAAVVDWLTTTGLPAAWLSLDVAERDPVRLVADVAAALDRSQPGAFGVVDARLETGTTPDQAPALLAELLAASAAREDAAMLVLDDVHVLDETPAALGLIDVLLRARRPGLHVCLLSRTRPALAGLPLAAARRELVVLDASDLAFRDDEAGAVLTQAGIEGSAATQLRQRADGWPAALVVLAARYEASAGRPRPSSELALAAFLAHEVLAGLAPDERELLEACSVLADVDAELAQDLSGRADAGRVLAELETTNQLINRREGGWYRMHALLRDRCLERLERESPAELRELRRRAARALSARGDVPAALELALSAEDHGAAVALLLTLHERLYQRGEWLTLTSALERLPGELLRAHPRLQLLRARVVTKLQRPLESLALLDGVVEGELPAEERVRLLLYRATALRQSRRFDEALRGYRRARALAQEAEPEGSALSAELELEEGIALGMSGHLEASRATLARAVEVAEGAGDARLIAESWQNLGTACLQSGDLAEALHAFESAQRRWVLLAEPEGQLLTLNNIASAQHLLGDLEGAAQRFREIQQRARELGLTRLTGFGLLGLADIERDRGDLAAAEPLYEAALEQAEAIDHGGLTAFARLGLALVYRERGEPARARGLLEQVERAAEQQGALELRARVHSALGATLLDEQRSEAAIEMLAQARQEAREAGAHRPEVLATFRLAAAQHAVGQQQSALATFVEVRTLTEALGYDRFLVVEARLARGLLELALTDPVTETYARELTQRASAPRATATPASRPATGGLLVRGFGTPAVTRPGASPADLDWRSERSKQLFFYLLHARGPATREQITLELWPEVAADRVSSLFHSTLHRLRRAVASDAVPRTRAGYELAPELVARYDVFTFEAALAAAEEAAPRSPERAAALRSALDCYGGPFGQTFDDDWAAGLRAHYETLAGAAGLRLAREAIEAGRYREAVAAAETLLRLDPLNEEAVRLLIAAEVGLGHPELATQAYRRLQLALAQELDEPPSGATRRVLEQLVPTALQPS